MCQKYQLGANKRPVPKYAGVSILDSQTPHAIHAGNIFRRVATHGQDLPTRQEAAWRPFPAVLINDKYFNADIHPMSILMRAKKYRSSIS